MTDDTPPTSAPTRETLLVKEGELAADYLEALLDIADLDGHIDMDEDGKRALVSVVEINPGELAHLVGRKGEVLDALQELTRLAVTRELGDRSRLMLDVGGFRAARRAEIERIAQEAVDEATRTGAPVRLDSMPAFERKIAHDVVAKAGLASESEGEEPSRYVVVRTA